jgi:hypothetical protein
MLVKTGDSLRYLMNFINKLFIFISYKFLHWPLNLYSCLFVFLSVAGESWHISWLNGHCGKVDKRTLQDMHGTKIQGFGGQQRTRSCSNWGQRHGLGEYLPLASPTWVKHFRGPWSHWWIQVTQHIYYLHCLTYKLSLFSHK